jgi:predicted dehydrogenase
VLCEKPLDARPAEVERAFDTAVRAGRILMEGFMYRHHPQTKRIAELVARGALGEPKVVRASFGFFLDDETNVRLLPELQGGSLLDVGCYCVSLSRLVAGEPLLASGQQVLGPTGVDLRFAGTLRFTGDVLAHFDCGFDVAPRDYAEIVGSEATLRIESPFVIAEPGLELVREQTVERIEVEQADRYRLELENLAAAIRGDEQPLLGRADAVGQARTLDALLRSASAGGEPVAL